jgi:uncharacterized membrane protein
VWQDTVIAVCQLTFVPSMLPTLFGPDKPAATTSALNAVIVSIIVVTQATLGLWLSVTTGTLIVATWSTLAIQKLRLRSDH